MSIFARRQPRTRLRAHHQGLFLAFLFLAAQFRAGYLVMGADAPVTPAAPTPTPTPAKPNAEQQAALDGAKTALAAVLPIFTNAVQLTTQTKSQSDAIGPKSALSATDPNLLRGIDDLTASVQALADASALGGVNTSLTALGTKDTEGARKTLADAQAKVQTEIDKADVPAEVKTSLNAQKSELSAQATKITTQATALGTARDGLLKNLDAVYDKIVALAGDVAAKDASVKCKPDSDGDFLLANLPNDLAVLKQTQAARQGIRDRWEGQGGASSLKSALTKASTPRPDTFDAAVAVGKVDKALTDLDTATNAPLNALEKVFTALGTDVKGQTDGLSASIEELMAADAASDDSPTVAARKSMMVSQKALKLSRDAEARLRHLQTIQTTWGELSALLAEPRSNFTDTDALKSAADGLAAQVLDHRGALSSVQDLLSGDKTHFKSDQVRLFYFTDVNRLMRSLNPDTTDVGGSEGVQERADLLRRQLVEAGLKVDEAQQRVNTAGGRVIELREQLRQSKASTLRAADLVKKSDRFLRDLTTKQTAAGTAQTKAQTALDGAADDAAKVTAKATLDQATKRKDDLDKLVLGASDRNTDAHEDDARERANYDALKDEQAGLPSQIQQAQEELSTAQSQVRKLNGDAFLAVSDELQAFARARDNASFLYAPANGMSTDVTRRVIMYAYPNSATIFLRGRGRDLQQVEDIIASFDQPVPQARLTLWTLELNSKTGKGGYDHFNDALAAIESNLSNTRTNLATINALLRDCVNRQVNLASVESGNEYAWTEDTSLARYYFYNEEVATRLGYQPHRPQVDVEMYKGFVSAQLPDPAATTTLGEALMVLTLAKRKYMVAAVDDFEARLKKLGISELDLDAKAKSKSISAIGDRGEATPYFRTQSNIPSLRAILGYLPGTSQDYVPTTALNASQLEILRALQRVAFDRAVADLKDQERQFVQDIGQLGDPREVRAEDKHEYFNALGTQFTLLRNRLALPVEWLAEEHPSPYTVELDQELLTIGDGANFDPVEMMHKLPNTLHQCVAELGRLSSRSSTNARIAACDEMLKEIITALEEDLDRDIVQPSVQKLRKQLAASGVGVGIMQRTSMLASNRLIARVDASATAQLEVGKETNALDAAKQLTQIALASQAGGLPATLGLLDTQKQDTKPELYGITSEGAFQVTPVIDPSGQALRFKFDYSLQNQIREPDGTVNPQLPHVTHHTVDTEVQISNMEIRSISQFSSNVKLGITKRRTGGIPILNDIKYISSIPIIGWFKQRSGSDAVAQQTVILAQTTIYPTILDIANLLTTARSSNLGDDDDWTDASLGSFMSARDVNTDGALDAAPLSPAIAVEPNAAQPISSLPPAPQAQPQAQPQGQPQAQPQPAAPALVQPTADHNPAVHKAQRVSSRSQIGAGR